MVDPTTEEPITKDTIGLAMQERLNAGDRGGAYLLYYEFIKDADREAAEQILIQAQIATYSGFFGGAALVGNSIAKHSNPAEYVVDLDEFSAQIISVLIDNINRDATNDDGILERDAILLSDRSVWDDKGLGSFFPGNIQMYSQGSDFLFTEGSVAAVMAALQLAFGARVGNEASHFAGSQYERVETEDYPELAAKIASVRTRLLSAVGQVTLAMAALPRYRGQSLSDLMHLVLEPLVRDRIAIASPKPDDEGKADVGALAGIAIWASVSDEVDAKIREQIKAGVFPIRLGAEDWRSGETVWLLDVIAPTQKLSTAVLANFRQVSGDRKVFIHPMVARMVDANLLKRVGAQPSAAATDTVN